MQRRLPAAMARAILILLMALASLFLMVFLTTLNAGSDVGTQALRQGERGPCDLRGIDFARAHLRVDFANVDFYPEAYVGPEDIGTATPEDYRALCEYGTQRVVLLLPDDDIYTLAFQIPGYAADVYVNGALARRVGTLGTSAPEVEPGYRWVAFQAVPEGGRMELLIQSANFIRARDGVHLPSLRIGLASTFEPEDLLINITSLPVMGALFGASILLLGIWLFHIRIRENLWFALECLIMAVRAGITGDTLQRIFPQLTAISAMRLEYASTSLLMVFLTLYTDKVFPGVYHRRVRDGIVILSALYTVATFLLPTQAISRSFVPSYVVVAAIILYFCARLCQKLRSPAQDQLISLMGVITFFVGAMTDLVRYGTNFAFLPQGRTLVETGLLVFVVFQMIALFVGNARQTAEARAAEKMLQGKTEMLQRLNRIKTEFLANVSHELKTPLAVVSGYAQVSQQQLPPDQEAARDKMRLIASEANRMALLVGQVLDVTRIEEGQMPVRRKPCSVDAFILQTVETHFPILNKNNNRLRIDISEGLPRVMGDAARLGQVIVNLIANSIKHTRDGEIVISARDAGGFVEIVVRDTGTGIEAGHLPQLFERYNRAQKTGGEGTGLGLYICKAIVEAHGGGIGVESTLGEGTAIWFTVPVAERAEMEAEESGAVSS